jgi:hypothetical protein
MPTWAIILLVVAALAAAYHFHFRKKHAPLATVAKGGGKKSRWRRMVGNAVKIAAPAIPGASSALAIGGQIAA